MGGRRLVVEVKMRIFGDCAIQEKTLRGHSCEIGNALILEVNNRNVMFPVL